MPYTLGKVFVWYLLAGLLGLALGWMLHHLLKCSQKGHGASTDVGADARAELDRLRARNANLEQVVGERDNLQRQLVDLRGVATERDSLKLEVGELRSAAVAPVAAFAGVSFDDHNALVAERDAALQAQQALAAERDAAFQAHNSLVAERDAALSAHSSLAAERDAALSAQSSLAAERDSALEAQRAAASERDQIRSLLGERDATIGAHEARLGEMQGFLAAAAAAGPSAPDVAGATAILGSSIKLDDLKVVEGIGPRIEELCHEIDIRTWWKLANTDQSVLRTMLDNAGPRFQMHDPSSWPQQANLLAHGRWAEFKDLTDRLDGGREVD